MAINIPEEEEKKVAAVPNKASMSTAKSSFGHMREMLGGAQQ